MRAIFDLKAVHEIAKRIDGAHMAPRAAAVLDEYRAVSELGAAGLHARVPLGWLVFLDFWFDVVLLFFCVDIASDGLWLGKLIVAKVEAKDARTCERDGG
jgi:hypothetical protein